MKDITSAKGKKNEREFGKKDVAIYESNYKYLNSNCLVGQKYYDWSFPILEIEKNPFIMRLSFQEKDSQHMFIEDIALITLSKPYSKTTRFIRPACIPIGPKFKDFG